MRLIRKKSDLIFIGMVGVLCSVLLISASAASAADSRLTPIMNFMLNKGESPGKPAAAGEGPDWMTAGGLIRSPRVLATNGSHRLFTYRTGDIAEENLCFAVDENLMGCMFINGPYDESAATVRDAAPWRLANLYVDVPQAYREVVYGIVDRSIDQVRLDYPDRPSEFTAPAATGGLILPVDLSKCPERIVGLDSAGNRVVGERIADLLARTGAGSGDSSHSFVPRGDEDLCEPTAKTQRKKHRKHRKGHVTHAKSQGVAAERR